MRFLKRLVVVALVLISVVLLKSHVVAAVDPPCPREVNLLDWHTSGMGCFSPTDAITNPSWVSGHWYAPNGYWARSPGYPSPGPCACSPLVSGASQNRVLEFRFLVYSLSTTIETYEVSFFYWRPTGHAAQLQVRYGADGGDLWTQALSSTFTANTWVYYSYQFAIPVGHRVESLIVAPSTAGGYLEHVTFKRTDLEPVYWPGYELRASGTRDPSPWWVHLLSGKEWQANLQVVSTPHVDNTPYAEIAFHARAFAPVGGNEVGSDGVSVGWPTTDRNPLAYARKWTAVYYFSGEDLGWDLTVYLPDNPGYDEMVVIEGLWDEVQIRSRAPTMAPPDDPPDLIPSQDVVPVDPMPETEGFWAWLFSPSEASITRWQQWVVEVQTRAPISFVVEFLAAMNGFFAEVPTGGDWSMEFGLESFPASISMDYDAQGAVLLRGFSKAVILLTLLVWGRGVYYRRIGGGPSD